MGLRAGSAMGVLLLVALLLQGCVSGGAERPANATRGMKPGEIVWLADESEMVLVPQGTTKVEESRGKEKVLWFSEFYIDKCEVTNGQFAAFLNDSRQADNAFGFVSRYPILVKGGWITKSSLEDYPARVTFEGALAYCKWAGKELPTWGEWTRAALGDDGRKYPWGNEWDKSRCVLGYGPAPVGSVPSGASPFGALDMAGNAWEWVMLLYLPRRTPKERDDFPIRMMTGGNWEVVFHGPDVSFNSLGMGLHFAECMFCGGNSAGFRCMVRPGRVHFEK